MKKPPEWTPILKSINELKPHPENARILKDTGLKILEESINEIGMAQPININTDNTILSGHARFYKLKEQGVEKVLCLVPDRELNNKEQKAVLTRMNKNIVGIWDFDILANNYEMEDLKLWGFNDFDFPQIIEPEDEPDYGALGESDYKASSDGVKKAIMIEFDAAEYQEAYDIVKKWRERGMQVGNFLISKLKEEEANFENK